MTYQYAKVKYDLYNARSIQADSDDEQGSDTGVTYKFMHRKAKNTQDTRVLVGGLSVQKSHSIENYSEPPLSLHRIARDGSVEKLEAWLNSLSPEACELQINKLDTNKRAPLHYAARYNHVCVTMFLLSKRANPDIRGENGLTPLHFASRYGYSKCFKDKSCSVSSDGTCKTVICKLIEAGADVNAQDNYGMTPLHYAAMRGNTVATEELLKSPQINLSIRDKQEMSPLHCAANFNSPKVVEFLLNANADPEAWDENYYTPLHLAATTGNKAIVLLLLDAFVKKTNCPQQLKQYIEMKNICGNSALHLAVTKGNYEVVQVLLNKGANSKIIFDNYSQPLHLAAATGSVETVKCLLDHGAEVNCINEMGETPLHKAAAYNAVDVVRFLLENKSEVESYDCRHCTPLLVAVSEGHVNVVDILLKAKANINAADCMDRNVILFAAQENHPDVLKMLLDYDNTNELVNRCDHYDNSPLHIAALQGFANIVEILLNYGAEIERKNEHEQTPLHLAAKNGHVNATEVLINHSKSVVNSEDENASTPLHLAAMCGHYLVINVLLNAGANLVARNCYLWTPLHCAASLGWKRCCQILLNAGSPVDPLDKSKSTPLHLAAQEGHKDVVKLLLKHEADIAHCDIDAKNCLDLALDRGHEDVALEILSDKNWEAVLRNESVKNKFALHQTPFRRLIRFMPDVAEHILNQCVIRNEFSEDHPKCEITYNYEFLDDMFACYQPSLYEQDDKDNHRTRPETSIFIGSNIYDENGHVKKKVPPYTEDKEVLKYNHPLMLMVTYGREQLLNHPLCGNLLNHKWKNYGRYVYYGNLIIFVLFIILLTSYVTTAVPPCPVDEADDNCCSEQNITCQPFIGDCSKYLNNQFPKLCRSLIYFLSVMHLLKEVYQVYQNGRKYLSIENILEWSCYLSALIFVADLTECSARTGIRQVWQWELGSLAIFSAWMVLLMFISKFPFLGIYVVMFIQILSTFIKFSFVFFLFVVAFALAFFAVLQNQDPFESPAESIMKTSVMMIGEIEFDAIFNDPNNKVYFKGPAYILFILFLLFMSIIIMNMLIGLAVDDIKEVQEKATLKRLAMKVEMVLTVERILPTVVLRKCITKCRTIKPNAWRLFPWYSRLLRIRPKFHTRISKAPLVKLQEKQNKLSKQLKDLQECMQLLHKDIKDIQTVMQVKSKSVIMK